MVKTVKIVAAAAAAAAVVAVRFGFVWACIVAILVYSSHTEPSDGLLWC